MLDNGMLGNTLEFQCEKREDAKNCQPNCKLLHVEVREGECVSEERIKAQVSARYWNLRRESVSCKLMKVPNTTMISHNRGDHGNPSTIIWTLGRRGNEVRARNDVQQRWQRAAAAASCGGCGRAGG